MAPSAPAVTELPSRRGSHPEPVAGELRIGDLSQNSGVSIDTIRYYQARGLLPLPRRQGRLAWYGSDHLRCLERIRSLQAQGLSLATIGRLLAGDMPIGDAALLGALTEKGYSGDGRSMTLDDVSVHTGLPTAILEAVAGQGLLGSHVPGDGWVFSPQDVETAKAGLVLLEWGVPLGELLEMARSHHEAMSAIAERAISVFDVYVRNPKPANSSDKGRSDKGDQVVDAFHSLLDATSTLVTRHFTRLLLHKAIERLDG